MEEEEEEEEEQAAWEAARGEPRRPLVCWESKKRHIGWSIMKEGEHRTKGGSRAGQEPGHAEAQRWGFLLRPSRQMPLKGSNKV